MNTQSVKVFSGNILEEESSLTLVEICQNCRAPAETIIRMIDHGIINPSKGTSSRQWRFRQSALLRADKALRLKRDLGVNLAGVALTLELLDEIDTLKHRLRHLQGGQLELP